MRVLRFSKSAKWLTLLSAWACLSTSCGVDRQPRSFDDADRRAEAALRDFGRPFFDVVSFHAEGREGQFVPDGFHRGAIFNRVHYVAEVRYTRDLRVLSKQETLARLRELDATTSEVELDVALQSLLGVGEHSRGSTQVVRNTAVFEEIESGWRLVAVDGITFELAP